MDDTSPETIDLLLEFFMSNDASSVVKDTVSRELFRLIQNRIYTILDDTNNLETVFKILDVVLPVLCNTCASKNSGFDVYFTNYLYYKLELFLQVAQSKKHSPDSLIWKIIALLGIYL